MKTAIIQQKEEETMYNPYKENGYEDRREYLESLSDFYGIDLFSVQMIADMLGESEDFDGLVSSLEDYSVMFM